MKSTLAEMNKRCLIIDNDDQSGEIEKMIRTAGLRGLKIECEQFNVGSTFDTELLTNGKIDITKVIQVYRARFHRQTFHLAAFDWDLSDLIVNGVELIRQFEHYGVLRNTPKLLYSGLLEDKLSLRLDEFRSGALNKSDLLNHLKTLIRIDIKDFVGRDTYENDIIRLLQNTEETLDLTIEEVLRSLPDIKFGNSFTNKNFNGKTFLQILQIMETNHTLRNEFKKEMIQQVIAYLSGEI